MGKRAERRKKGVVPFGQIIYYTETQKYTGYNDTAQVHYQIYSAQKRKHNILTPTYAGGKFRYVKQEFASYEEALVYALNFKLGLVPYTPGYSWLTMYKVIGGYISKGRKVITHTKIFEKLRYKYERFGVRRNEFSDRLFRKQRGPSLPFPEAAQADWYKALDDAFKPRELTTFRVARRFDWNAGSVRRTTPVVRRSVARPKPIPTAPRWPVRAASSRITSPRDTALQKFSKSTLARAQQNRYR